MKVKLKENGISQTRLKLQLHAVVEKNIYGILIKPT